MSNKGPVDYQEALDQFRKEEHTPDNPVRSNGLPSSVPMTDGYVDYQAIIKEWDKEQEGKYKIHLQTGKRNPSHDPICKKPAGTNPEYLIS